jgi:hypothetical protein
VKLVLVGNKVDLEDQRQVTLRRGEKVLSMIEYDGLYAHRQQTYTSSSYLGSCSCVIQIMRHWTIFMQLARQHRIDFFETSAWSNICITESFVSLAKSILTNVSHVIGKVVCVLIELVFMQAERNAEDAVAQKQDKVVLNSQSAEGSGAGGWTCCS